jgi:hypothetical protein
MWCDHEAEMAKTRNYLGIGLKRKTVNALLQGVYRAMED